MANLFFPHVSICQNSTGISHIDRGRHQAKLGRISGGDRPIGNSIQGSALKSSCGLFFDVICAEGSYFLKEVQLCEVSDRSSVMITSLTCRLSDSNSISTNTVPGLISELSFFLSYFPRAISMWMCSNRSASQHLSDMPG